MISSFSGIQPPARPQVQFQGYAPLRRTAAGLGAAVAAGLGFLATQEADTLVKAGEAAGTAVVAYGSARLAASTTKLGAEGFDKGMQKVVTGAGALGGGLLAARHGVGIADGEVVTNAVKILGLDMPVMWILAKATAKDTPAAGFFDAVNTRVFDTVVKKEGKMAQNKAVNKAAADAAKVERKRVAEAERERLEAENAAAQGED